MQQDATRMCISRNTVYSNYDPLETRPWNLSVNEFTNGSLWRKTEYIEKLNLVSKGAYSVKKNNKFIFDLAVHSVQEERSRHNNRSTDIWLC